MQTELADGPNNFEKNFLTAEIVKEESKEESNGIVNQNEENTKSKIAHRDEIYAMHEAFAEMRVASIDQHIKSIVNRHGGSAYEAFLTEFNDAAADNGELLMQLESLLTHDDLLKEIPLVEKANPSLDDYVTKQALNGLFSMVQKEEKNIRTNVSARTTELLKKVFAKQDNK